MRKTILSLTLLLTLLSHAQDLWTETCLFPNQDFYVSKISIADDNVIWMSGSNQTAPGNNSQIWWRSTDSGTSWQHGSIDLGNPDLHVNSISAISENTAYISASSLSATETGGIWTTSNAGLTWTRQLVVLNAPFVNEPFDHSSNYVHFWNTNRGIAIGNPQNNLFETYNTVDAGVTWTAVATVNLPAALPNEKGLFLPFEPREHSIWFSTNKGRVFKSDDDGLNWSVSQAPDSQSYATLAFKNENDGILVSSGSTLPHYTSNGGITWNANHNEAVGAIRRLQTFVPGTQNTYFSWFEEILDFQRGSSYSTDNGQSWIDLRTTDERPIEDVQSVSFKSNTVGYCIGLWPDGLHFFKLNSEAFHRLLQTQDVNIETVFVAAPNPAVDVVRISGKDIQSIALFDLSGKKVLNQNYPVSDDVVLDISKLRSGIYLVKITDRFENSSAVKIVKE